MPGSGTALAHTRTGRRTHRRVVVAVVTARRARHRGGVARVPRRRLAELDLAEALHDRWRASGRARGRRVIIETHGKPGVPPMGDAKADASLAARGREYEGKWCPVITARPKRTSPRSRTFSMRFSVSSSTGCRVATDAAPDGLPAAAAATAPQTAARAGVAGTGVCVWRCAHAREVALPPCVAPRLGRGVRVVPVLVTWAHTRQAANRPPSAF